MARSNPKPPRFVGPERAAARIAQLLEDPETAAEVGKIREAMRQQDEQYRVSLAKVRRAARLSQEALAERMGTRQSNVSRLEHSDDLLLSTLASYLAASGATRATITVEVDDTTVDLDLPLSPQ